MVAIGKQQSAKFRSAIDAIMMATEKSEGALTQKKRAVITSAILIFAEQGFAASSTKQIAIHAGVAEATIFKHFKTKKGLLLSLVKPIFIQNIVPAARDSLHEIIAENKDNLEDVLCAVLLNRLAFIRQYFPLVRIVIQELPFQTELQDLLKSQQKIAVGELYDIFELEINSGRIVNQDASSVMRQFLSVFFGYLISTTYLNPKSTFDDKKEIRLMVSNLLYGMLQNPAQSRP